MTAAMGRTLPALAAGIVASVLVWAVGYAVAVQYGVAVSGCVRTEETWGGTTTAINRQCMAALPDAPPEPLTLAVVVGLAVALASWACARTRRGQ